MGIKQAFDGFINHLKCSPKLALYLSVAAVCIIALLMMKSPEAHSAKAPAPEQVEAPEPSADYQTELEERLKQIISQIGGVSDVSVMLTLDGSEQKVFASDTSESDSKVESKTVIAGSKEALLESTKYPQVRGVLVVCKGGGKAAVKEKVVNAVATVLDISTSKVYVTDAK